MKEHKCLCFFILFLIPLSVAQAQNNDAPSDTNYQQQFNPSLAIIIIILVAALFLMGFFSIYIRQCADSPSNSMLPASATGGRSRRGARGLDPAVIETFPILEYSEVKIHKIGKEVLECAVCLCEFEDTETLRLIPKCDHVFHPQCIDEWLGSHTTCPVCRANLVPQPGESVHALPLVPNPNEHDIEAQNDAVGTAPEQQQQQQQINADAERPLSEPESGVLEKSRTLNRNRTRGSRSSRRRRFPRSHSTGHSLVQPGENTDRFTLKLPAGVRREIINRELQRANSLVVLPREGSSRVAHRTGEGSSRGKIGRLLDRSFKSDRWVFTRAPPFLVRGSSIRSPRVGNSAGEGTSSSAAVSDSVPASAPIMPPTAFDSARPPV